VTAAKKCNDDEGRGSDWGRVAKEIERLLADNSDLVQELDDFDRAYELGDSPATDRTRRCAAASTRGRKLASSLSDDETDPAVS
jgi:hypothetical protein